MDFFITTHLYLLIKLSNNFVATCAWSHGGPGLNFGEHNAGSSTLGTETHSIYGMISVYLWKLYNLLHILPTIPLPGSLASG